MIIVVACIVALGLFEMGRAVGEMNAAYTKKSKRRKRK